MKPGTLRNANLYNEFDFIILVGAVTPRCVRFHISVSEGERKKKAMNILLGSGGSWVMKNVCANGSSSSHQYPIRPLQFVLSEKEPKAATFLKNKTFLVMVPSQVRETFRAPSLKMRKKKPTQLSNGARKRYPKFISETPYDKTEDTAYNK